MELIGNEKYNYDLLNIIPCRDFVFKIEINCGNFNPKSIINMLLLIASSFPAVWGMKCKSVTDIGLSKCPIFSIVETTSN